MFLGAHFSNSAANSDFYGQYLRIGGSWEKVARIDGFASSNKAEWFPFAKLYMLRSFFFIFVSNGQSSLDEETF